MPTYGYRCTVCAHEFERFQKITDPALTDCESCGSAVKKILYPVGIQFVGSGFYVNDYAKSGGNGRSAAKDGGTSPASAEGKSETKADTAATSSTPAAAPTPSSGTSSS